MRDFDEQEDLLWRSLMRLTGALPRLLEDDLSLHARLSLSEFAMLLALSEADGAGRRMTDLANAGGLSPSRATRVVADLERRGLVEKSRDATDARGNVAVVTAEGRRAFKAAYPVQVDRARKILFDHLSADETRAVAKSLSQLLERVNDAAR